MLTKKGIKKMHPVIRERLRKVALDVALARLAATEYMDHLDGCADCLGALLHAKSEEEMIASLCQEGRMLREEEGY